LGDRNKIKFRMAYKFKTTKDRSCLMQKIRSVNTTPELILRKILKSNRIRYVENDKKLPGKPDISLYRHRIAIFIDGEFWHGFNWVVKKRKIKANRTYWIPKIEKNIARDKKNNLMLKKNGWKVLRFWESAVTSNPQKCLNRIRVMIKKVKYKNEKT